jgi:hypothetical protein
MKSYPEKIRFVKEESLNAESLTIPTFLRSQNFLTLKKEKILIDAISKLIVYCCS